MRFTKKKLLNSELNFSQILNLLEANLHEVDVLFILEKELISNEAIELYKGVSLNFNIILRTKEFTISRRAIDWILLLRTLNRTINRAH